jgi:hypothetical protein
MNGTVRFHHPSLSIECRIHSFGQCQKHEAKSPRHYNGGKGLFVFSETQQSLLSFESPDCCADIRQPRRRFERNEEYRWDDAIQIKM